VTADAIRVVVADDQRVVRDGLVTLIGLMNGIEVVATASNGHEAVAGVERERPDVVLMDLGMPVLDGVEATRRICDSGSDTKVLVLTTFADDASLFPALRAGARGYLTKDASAEEIEQAIRSVAAGLTHLDPAIQERVIAAALDSGRGVAATAATAAAGLTPREVDVLKLIAAGLSNAEIAAALVVSDATVKTHINRVFAKTGARDRAQAVRYAFQHGLA
jgi:DNA-binding NarL/FixJ family response regulator